MYSRKKPDSGLLKGRCMLDMGKPQKLEELQTHVIDVRVQANFVE